jgi:hypothetical protein
VSEDQDEEDLDDELFDTGPRGVYKWLLLLRMDHQKILSNLETWDKIRDAIPKVLE